MRFARARAALAALAFYGSVAQAATTVWLQSDPTHILGQGQTVRLQTPADSISVDTPPDFQVSVSVQTPAGGSTRHDFVFGQDNQNPPIAAGVFELAANSTNHLTPRLSVSIAGQGCTNRGRFVILELERDLSMNLSKFAANFEHYCAEQGGPDTAPRMYGEVRINSSIPLTVDRAAGYTTPDEFRFQRVDLAVPPALPVSNAIAVYGINAPAPISITGGEYSVEGGPFTSAPGTVSNRAHVRVRTNSFASPALTATAVLNVGGRTANFDVQTYGPGIPFNGLAVTRPGSEPSFLGVQSNIHVIQLPQNGSPSYAFMEIHGRVGEFFLVGLMKSNGGFPGPGVYESAWRAGIDSTSPGFDFIDFGSDCNGETGRFVIHEVAYASDGAVTRLAVDLERDCNNGSSIYAELRIDSTIPLRHMVASGATVAAPFALLAPGPVRGGSLVTSNSTTVFGINAPTSIAIAGGEYSVNGGPFTSAPGTVVFRDRVVVRMLASKVPGALNQATLDIGGRSATLAVNTYQAGTALTGLLLRGAAGNTFVPAQTRFFLSPQMRVESDEFGWGDTKPAYFDLVGPLGTRGTLIFGGPNDGPLSVGVYEDVQEWPLSTTSAEFSFDFEGKGCSNERGRFVVREITYKPNGFVEKLAVDFEHHCETTQPALWGELRFNSTVPFSTLLRAPDVPGTDFSGDGSSDLLFRNTDGRQAIWLMSGLAPTATNEIIGAGTGWRVTHVADFDSDGRKDLVWRHDDGRMAIYLMNGTVATSTQQLLNTGSPWTVTHAPDFDGDGKADLLFKSTTGEVAIWLMNGTTVGGTVQILGAGTGWSVTLAADFDADGKQDLLWTHADGRVAIWLMDGIAVKATLQILDGGSGWRPTQAPDINGDGKADILWQHADGSVAYWLMNGTTLMAGSTLLGPGSGWAVTHVADFDADGRHDLFFQHPDGRAAIWLMSEFGPTTQTQILNAGGGWSAKRLMDLNADGKADIVWENVDGRVAVWLMNGTAMTSGSGILGPGTGWSVSGASQ